MEFSTTSHPLSYSLGVTLSVVRKKPHNAELLSPQKRTNEQELYAAVAHHWLTKNKPALAQDFEQKLAGGIESYNKNHEGSLNMHKVADRIVRQYVRTKQLSQEEYKTMRSEVFGRSQLDSDRSWSSNKKVEGSKYGDTPVRAISSALKKYDQNFPASIEEIALFRAREAEISRALYQEKKAAGTLKSKAAETLTLATHSNSESTDGFLWKPISDSDGKLVVLLPSALTGTVTRVDIFDPSHKKVLGSGRYSGIGNGEREHFRFALPGNSYPPGSILEITFKVGTKTSVLISEPSERKEGASV